MHSLIDKTFVCYGMHSIVFGRYDAVHSVTDNTIVCYGMHSIISAKVYLVTHQILRLLWQIQYYACPDRNSAMHSINSDFYVFSGISENSNIDFETETEFLGVLFYQTLV